MYVLFDLEWVTAADGLRTLTQLAALRTSSAWVPCAEFHTLARPAEYDADWEHLAYSGYSPDEFRFAPDEKDALLGFLHWLKEGDVLCCWHYENGKTLEMLCKCWTGSKLPHRWAAVNQAVYECLAQKGITEPGGLYRCAQRLGLATPVPEHDSCHDVLVLQQLVSGLHLSDQFLHRQCRPRPQPVPEDPAARRKQNAEAILRAQYHYVYLPDSPVFHRWDCRLVLNSRSIQGCTHYKTAAKKRRPCLVCKPEPGLLTAQETAHQCAPQNIGSTPEDWDGNEVIRVRLLGGQSISVRRKLLVGCCHNRIHPGKMNQRLMEEHNCLGKECRFFEKYEYATYWRIQAGKNVARRQAKLEKQQKRAHRSTVFSYQNLFQSYADELGYSLKIIRVQEETPSVFKIFFISDNPFRDGGRFPNFISMIQEKHPQFRIIMRHIRALDGHFVTIDEYAQIKR